LWQPKSEVSVSCSVKFGLCFRVGGRLQIDHRGRVAVAGEGIVGGVIVQFSDLDSAAAAQPDKIKQVGAVVGNNDVGMVADAVVLGPGTTVVEQRARARPVRGVVRPIESKPSPDIAE
jgi:hypothetical protein